MVRRKWLSPTAINTYLRCPREYYYRYIKRRKTKPNIYLLRGIAVHEALAKFYDQGITPESKVDRLRITLIHLFSDAWSRQQNTINCLGLSQEEIDNIYKESINMLYAWFFRLMEKLSIGVKKPRTETKLFSRRFSLMGIVDAIYEHDGVVTLLDYKTSVWDDLTPEIRVQMSLYALLYQENHGRPPDMICVDFLGTGRKHMQPVSESMIKHAKQLCWVMKEKTQSLDRTDYPCTCGGLCERKYENVDASSKGDT